MESTKPNSDTQLEFQNCRNCGCFFAAESPAMLLCNDCEYTYDAYDCEEDF